VKKDWKEAVAGQRVEIIKPHESKGWFKHEEGQLEFGTELVVAEDRSIVVLLGASPGASTAASIAIGVLEKCFKDELTANGWLPKLKKIIPSYGESLIKDVTLLRRVRADTASVLRLDNV
jgi:malate dehydrogenase (quinone)